MKPLALKILVSFIKGVWIWALLTWVFVALTILDPITNPFQRASLSFYIDVPTDLVGIIAFVVAFMAFVLWEVLRK